MKSNILKHLVVYAVNNLKECGLFPISTVCDQGANNLKLYVSKLGVTEKKPFFMVNGIKTYTIFDAPIC